MKPLLGIHLWLSRARGNAGLLPALNACAIKGVTLCGILGICLVVVICVGKFIDALLIALDGTLVDVLMLPALVVNAYFYLEIVFDLIRLWWFVPATAAALIWFQLELVVPPTMVAILAITTILDLMGVARSEECGWGAGVPIGIISALVFVDGSIIERPGCYLKKRSGQGLDA